MEVASLGLEKTSFVPRGGTVCSTDLTVATDGEYSMARSHIVASSRYSTTFNWGITLFNSWYQRRIRSRMGLYRK